MQKFRQTRSKTTMSLHGMAFCLVSAVCFAFPSAGLGQDNSVDPLPNFSDDAQSAAEISLSVGDSDHGELIGGVELPRRANGLLRLSHVSSRNSGWGTKDLVDLILRAASALHRLPDHREVPLRVGNLSLRRGGEMRWSHSHRSGRDADILLYLLDHKGNPQLPDDFVTLDARGVGKHKKHEVVFDSARMWRIVAVLLQDSHVQVQHLYLAQPLRQMLLAHARAIGESEGLIQRARLVLSEPAHAGKHDDHMHIRVYCSRDDRMAGCSDDGPRWPWVQGFDHEVRQQVSMLIAELGRPSPDARAKAIERLTWFQHSDERALEALAWIAGHDTPRNRGLATQGLIKLAEPRAFSFLMAQSRQVDDPARALGLVQAALAVATPENAAELCGLLAADGGEFADVFDAATRSQVRRAAAQTLRPWLLEEAAEPLVAALDDADPTARRAALKSLEFLANRAFAAPEAAAAWFERARDKSRLQWMYEGFVARGLPMSAPPKVLAPKLIALLQDSEPAAAANAHAMLQRMVDHGPIEATATESRRQRAWSRWWEVNRQRYTFEERDSAVGDDFAAPSLRAQPSGRAE